MLSPYSKLQEQAGRLRSQDKSLLDWAEGHDYLSPDSPRGPYANGWTKVRRTARHQGKPGGTIEFKSARSLALAIMRKRSKLKIVPA